MKTLVLVRHAKSSWDHAGLADFDRPLADRGQRDAPRMVKRFSARNNAPDIILSSPARRAAETAAIFQTGLGLDDDRLVFDRQIYEADLHTLLGVVQALHDSWNSAMLVGHNPGLTQLCAQLVADAPANIPTAGVAVISIATDSWQNVRAGSQNKLQFDYPKNPTTP